jgi:hypothetical protein
MAHYHVFPIIICILIFIAIPSILVFFFFKDFRVFRISLNGKFPPFSILPGKWIAIFRFDVVSPRYMVR